MKSICLTLHKYYNVGGVNVTIPVDNIAYAKDLDVGTQVFFKFCTFKETSVIVTESAYEIDKLIRECK